MSYKIAVIGAGVQGLASALCLSQQFLHSHITVIASEFYPETRNICSSHGLGLVISTTVGEMGNEDITDYIVTTMKYCSSFKKDYGKIAGILPIETILFCNGKEGLQMCAKDQQKLGFQRLSDDEAKPYDYIKDNGAKLFHDFRKDHLTVYKMTSYVIDCNRYLTWLKQKLESTVDSNGSKRISFQSRHVESFAELAPFYDLVINCSALGAKYLANDNNVVPIRGQYVSVAAPFVDKVYMAGETIVIPRCDDVGLGVTAQVGRSDIDPDPKDSDDIRRRCEALFPPIKNAKLRYSNVGIRPARIGGARVELELVNLNSTVSSKLPVIHNYGHGTKGFAQHWGCAQKVVKLASQALSSSFKL